MACGGPTLTGEARRGSAVACRWRQEPGLHRQSQIIAYGPVFEGAAIICNPEQVDVLHGERLVSGGNAVWKASLMRSAHRYVCRRHVPVDQHAVYLVGDVAEAGAQPVAGRDCTRRPLRRSGSAS